MIKLTERAQVTIAWSNEWTSAVLTVYDKAAVVAHKSHQLFLFDGPSIAAVLTVKRLQSL